MTQRTERIAGEIRQILGEIIVRDEIKDPRVRIAGIITFTHVRVSGDLRQATAYFTVHGMDEESLLRVRQGLAAAASYMRRRIADRLRLKSTPALMFDIDRVFEQEAHIDALLHEVEMAKAEEGEAAEEGAEKTAEAEEVGHGQEHGHDHDHDDGEEEDGRGGRGDDGKR